MRSRRVATALVVLSAGVAATAALRRFTSRRRAAAVAWVPPAPVEDRDAVVLTFAPRPAVAPVAERPAAPARCGDNGGRTKSGAPCGARATIGGRCHHHRVAA